MVPPTALVPVVLLLALGADAAPPRDRRALGPRPRGTKTLESRAATTTNRASSDFQTYNLGVSGIYAPAVTQNGDNWVQSGQQYNYLYDALVNSCYAQANNCANSFNVNPFDKVQCWGSQVLDCTSNAQSAASAYSSKAASWSTSAASANYAKATQARTTSGDLQTFTGALGGIIAPAVTVSGSKWVSSGQTYNFLKEALDGSCYNQMNQCQQAANAGGNKLELTVANCNGPQIQACLSNNNAIISSQGAAATASASAFSSSWSAQSASASQYSASASQYSASQRGASASAYSYSSSSSAAAARATSSAVASTSSASSSASSAAKSSSSSAPAVSSSSASPTASSSASGGASNVAGNAQTFTGNIGGLAPAVTQNAQGQWTQSGNTYGSLFSALQQSCYAQASTCSTASSVSDKSPCWGTQVQSCLTAAQTISDSYTSQAAQYSSSVASANYAKATAARTVQGDLQSFTGALGGIAAPAVTGSPQAWYMNNIYFYNLIDALQQSCWVQMNWCLNQVANAGASYEMTVNNCQNVQQPACASNAQNIVANYGKSSSSAASSTASSSSAASSAANTASASAYSASSLAAYSQSVQNNQAQQSAASYSASVSGYSAAASAYSASASSYSASVNAAQALASGAAYSASAAAYSASSSAAAAAASASASAYAVSAAAYSASSSAAAVAASAAAVAASASAAAYSVSAAAYSATSSLAAYSASVSGAAYSVSAAAYSASSSAAAAAASASAALAAVPAGWSRASTACIAEGTTGRALQSDATFGNDMTWGKCTSYCQSKGYPLAGIEYSSECYCGFVLSHGASLTRSSDNCNMFAAGSNGVQAGGGPNALTLFVSNSLDLSKLTPDLSGVVAQIPQGWTETTATPGICIKEGTSGRALAGAVTAADDMTIGKCITFCKSKGMQYAGLEYSRECYCGNDLVNGASKDQTAPCDMQCAGAPGTICGGPGLLTVYQSPDLVYTAAAIGDFRKQGCIQEVGGRALNEASIATNDMTLEKCTSYCGSKGYAFAGLEYASECYCGNTLANGATLSAFSTQCSMPCSGNSGEICGGPNAISLYATVKGLALVGA